MRKRLKLKRHSCAMCKAHKMHGAPRWKDRDLQALKLAERSIREQRSL